MRFDPILQSGLVLVGPGRAGRALARSWLRAGGTLTGLIVRAPESGARAAAELGAERRTAESVWDQCGILVLAVPDDDIAATAAKLAPRTRCRLVLHLSGALPASVLAPFSASGAALGSLHPLRAFTGDPREDWRGAFVAIEGDPAALEAGERIAAALGASGHRLSSEAKPLYHAAATLAAGGTMALLSIAVRAAVDAGLPEFEARPALARLASEAAAAIAERRLPEAFTGPVARRDVQTVRAHCRAAAGRADFLDLYRRLAEEILAATAGRGREEEIRKILAEPAESGRH